MASKKFDLQLRASIFNDLVDIQSKLPARATNGRADGDPEMDKKAQAYENPAALALLGTKDGEVDTVIPLKMAGGCWDAPHINYDSMDAGFQALIAKDRLCCGMALVRNPRWNVSHDSMEAKMPDHLRVQLHGMRNSFSDITKTTWIVLHNDYFRVYKPTRSKDGKISAKELPIDKLFSKEDRSDEFVKAKIDRDKGLRKAKALEIVAKRKALADRRKEEIRVRKEEADRQERIRKEELSKQEAAKQAAEQKAARIKKKVDIMNAKLKEGKDAIIDAGNGYVWMRQPDGSYVYWQTGV